MTFNKKKLTKELFEFAPVDATLKEKINKPSLSFWKDAWLRLKENKAAVLSIWIIILLTIIAIIGPIISPYTYKETIYIDKQFTLEEKQDLAKEYIMVQIIDEITDEEKETIFKKYWEDKGRDPETKRKQFDRTVEKAIKENAHDKVISADENELDQMLVEYFKYTGKEWPRSPGNTIPPRVPGLEKLGLFDGVRDGINVYQDLGIEDKYFWFGTDELGRDLFTRVWYGTRISIFIGLLAAVIDLLVGVTYGSCAGYFGGKVDIVLMRIIEVIWSIPVLVIVTILILILEPGLMSIALAIGLTGWMSMARIVRAQILKLKNQEFVLAARTLGTSSSRLIMKHLIPNVMGQIIIVTTFSVPNAIFYEAFLAFIGLGLPAPQASLGVLINEGYQLLRAGYPYLMIIPSTVICLLMLALNLFANGLRDALDPKLRNK